MRRRTRRTLTQYLVSEPSTRRRRTAHRVRFGPLSRFRAPKAHSPWAISLRITRFDRSILGLCSLAEPFSPILKEDDVLQLTEHGNFF